MPKAAKKTSRRRKPAEKAAPSFDFHGAKMYMSAVVGQEFSATLPAAFDGAAGVRYRCGPLPAGVSFNPAARVLSGRPEVLAVGKNDLRYAATHEGRVEVMTLFLSVHPAP